MDVDEVRRSLQRFGWPDYTVFMVMLTSCALIGVYFALQMRRQRSGGGKKDAADDYLVGGRRMKVFPISMSLISSFISGITLLGTPTEVYLYGVQYLYIVGALLIMGFVMFYFFLPVFHDLKLISTYQYLESRFDKRLRLFGSLLFICGSLLWLPIVIYVPALAFNQATGVNVHHITPLVCLVCIFYTCVGGLKAVVWTDVVQSLIMFGSMALVVVKGTMDIGGPAVVYQRASESGRIEALSMKFDLLERYTIYSVLLGGVPHWLKSNAINQNMIQRYLSLPTLRSARIAIWIFIGGVLCFLCLCGYSGLLLYATYHDCDPLQTKLAKRNDQLLPLLVMETLGEYPGLPGLFVAGVFSAALSSLSTSLNSMSAVVLEDFGKRFWRPTLTERHAAYIVRCAVVVFGTICVGLVFVVERLGTVLQLSITLSSVANGPLLGVFVAGVMVPWMEGTGALVGGMTSIVFMAWMCVNAQTDLANGVVSYTRKAYSIDGCNYTFTDFMSMSMLAETHQHQQHHNSNDTVAAAVVPHKPEQPFHIYNISYLYYTTVGATITIVIGVLTSCLLRRSQPHAVDPKLCSPFVRRWLERKYHTHSTVVPIQYKHNTNNSNSLHLDVKTATQKPPETAMPSDVATTPT